MKLSHLLLQREALLRQSRLANLAFAYWQLGSLVTRIAGAGLRGKVCLQPADPGTERSWPVLTALEGSQSVIEEHFTDENIGELADLVFFLTGGDDVDTTFRLEDMGAKFLTPLQHKLALAGVEFEQPEGLRLAGPNLGNPDRH
jgi:hypothetical protein